MDFAAHGTKVQFSSYCVRVYVPNPNTSDEAIISLKGWNRLSGSCAMPMVMLLGSFGPIASVAAVPWEDDLEQVQLESSKKRLEARM